MAVGPAHVLAAVAQTAAQLPGKEVLEDVTFQPLTFRRLMTGVGVLAGRWQALLGRTPVGGRVGVLLPNVNAVPVTLLSLWAVGRVPAILNFSTGIPVMKLCLELAGVKQVITSRAFLQKAKLDLAPLTATGLELVYLEDVRAGVSGMAKLACLMRNLVSCGGAYRELSAGAGDTAVIFENGSGWPGYVPDAYVRNYPAKRFAMLAYSVADTATMRSYVNLARARNVGYVYITNDGGANPWDTLPTYWAAFVDYVAQGNGIQ